jgi:hypothetical protein
MRARKDKLFYSLGMVVNVSSAARKYVTQDVIDAMFRGGLTDELVDTLKVVIKNCVTLRSHIQMQLRVHITSTLQRYVVIVDENSYAFATTGSSIINNAMTNRTNPTTRTQRGLVSESGGQELALANAFPSSSSNLTNKLWETAGNLFQHPGAGIATSNLNNSLDPDKEILLALKVLASPDFFPKV